MTEDFHSIEQRKAQVREAAEKARERDAQISKDLEWLMRDKRGRRYVFELLSTAGVYRTTFIEAPQRAHYMAEAMAFEEGRKQVGYRMLARLMRVCPSAYARMIKENSNE